MDHFEREKMEKAAPLIEAAFQHRLADEQLFMNVSNRYLINLLWIMAMYLFWVFSHVSNIFTQTIL